MKSKIFLVSSALLYFLIISVSMTAQTADTLYLNYKSPMVFETINIPGSELYIWDCSLDSEMANDSAFTWIFPNAIVGGITDCKYGIEFHYNTVQVVFLRAKNDAGIRNIRNFVIDMCPDFTLTGDKRNNYSYCGYHDFDGTPCMICYTENRKKRTALMEISCAGE